MAKAEAKIHLKTGLTELDDALVEWLDTHHIRGKDVYSWSTAGSTNEMTVATISFYVSNVDSMPDNLPDGQNRYQDVHFDVTEPRFPDIHGFNKDEDKDTEEPDFPVAADSQPEAPTEQFTFDRPRPFLPYGPDEPRPYSRRPIKDNPQG